MGNVPPPAVTGGKGEPFWYELDVFWVVWRLGAGVLPASLEAVAVAVHLQDVDVVGEAVQQGSGEPFGSKTSVHSSKGRLVVTRTEPRS